MGTFKVIGSDTEITIKLKLPTDKMGSMIASLAEHFVDGMGFENEEDQIVVDDLTPQEKLDIVVRELKDWLKGKAKSHEDDKERKAVDAEEYDL